MPARSPPERTPLVPAIVIGTNDIPGPTPSKIIAGTTRLP